MAAPKGNQFYLLRSKHGRDKLFASAELMWEAAVEYFNHVDDNPEIEIDFRGKDAYKVELPKKQPYTIAGLTNYLDVSVQYFNEFKQNVAGKQDAESKDFSAVISRIEQVIYNQKFSGAASGFFNANIIARELGLADRQQIDNTHRVQHNIDTSKLSDAALQELENAASNKTIGS